MGNDKEEDESVVKYGLELHNILTTVIEYKRLNQHVGDRLVYLNQVAAHMQEIRTAEQIQLLRIMYAEVNLCESICLKYGFETTDII